MSAGRVILSRFVVVLILIAGVGCHACAQRNNRVMNRPYTDLRPWHLGFSVGLHTQDLQLTHNGYVTPDGESWFVEQPDFSPGFCVGGLVDFRLNEWFSLRVSPGIYFGNRSLVMRDHESGAVERQDIKSNQVVLPVDLKYASLRYRNVRPYLVGGVMGAFDVSERHARDLLQLNSADVLVSLGLGCDIYLPYFKLCPELKFCFGLTDMLRHDRSDLADDPDRYKFTQSLAKAATRMVVLTFYFE